MSINFNMSSTAVEQILKEDILDVDLLITSVEERPYESKIKVNALSDGRELTKG